MRAWALAGALALTVALAGCGSSGTDGASNTQAAAIPSNCPDAALGAIEGVAHRVYQESATGRIVREAVQRLESSRALAGAMAGDDPGAAHRALEGLLNNQIVSVRAMRDGRTLAKIERGAGIAPASGPILNARGQSVGAFTVSVQGANGYAQTVAGLLDAQVVVRSEGRGLTATLHPAPGPATGRGEVSYRGVSYHVDTFAGRAFPDRPLRISLLVPASSIAAVCGRRGGAAGGAAAAASTLGRVVERVYYGEQKGSKAKLILGYVERSRAFREAVLAGDAKATRAAIIGFFRSRLHIVRVRVIRAGKLLVDVGGPHVPAPIAGVIRDARGDAAAHFLLAIQDDLGLEILARTFTGAQVLMREGARQVKGTLSPGPAAIPDHGRVLYDGTAYQAYSFNAEAFPSGPLRISLLFPAA